MNESSSITPITTVFDRDITPTPHPTIDGAWIVRFNPRWKNGLGKPLGGLYIPIILRSALLELRRKKPEAGYEAPVSCYTQYLKSADLDGTCLISVRLLKAGKTMCFLRVSIYQLKEKDIFGSLKGKELCTTSSVVFAAQAQLPTTYPRARSISHLKPRASSTKLPFSQSKTIELHEALGFKNNHAISKCFSFKCDPDQAAKIRGIGERLRRKLIEGVISPEESQEHFDLVLEYHVGFPDAVCSSSAPPQTKQIWKPRPHDWESVGLMTDCMSTMNMVYAIELSPTTHQFWATTINLAIHFFPPFPEPPSDEDSRYLFARAGFTIVDGGLSELEVVVWDHKAERVIATGRQTLLAMRKPIPGVVNKI